MPTSCAIAALAAVVGTSAAEPLTNAPAISTNLPLRSVAVAAPAQIDLPDTPGLVVAPIASIPLADAQLATLRAPEAWRSWASLALAHYKAGNYEKSAAATRQMRAAAAARAEPLPLAAEDLARKCLRAAAALTILD